MGKPLDYTADWFKQRPLSVVIYWHPRSGPDAAANGHASLIIDTRRFQISQTDFYVSWVGVSNNNPFKGSGQACTYYNDMQEWSSRSAYANTAVPMHAPTRWVALSGLDIGAMEMEWNTIRTKAHAHWKIFNKNCATVVARVLKAGRGDDYANRAKSQIVWWPSDLITYSRSMGPNVFERSDG